MANIFTSFVNGFGDWLGSKIAPYINDAMGVRGNILSSYYQGNHRPQLKKKEGQPDDNIFQNFVGLAVNRSVSRLFRGGVEFMLPEGADAQQEYLDRVWDLNKKEIALYQAGLHGAVYGTSYFKIIPFDVVDPYTEKLYPRLTAIDPEIIRVITDPQDMNEVREYVIEYKIEESTEGGGVREVAHREITRHAKPNDEGMQNDTWVVEQWEQSVIYGNQWTLVSSTPWPFNFPPIVHWKNLPSLKTCYGESEESDIINLQDKNNFAVSNTGKVIKNYAHPNTFVFGLGVKQLAEGRLDNAVGTLYAIDNVDAKAMNLEMQSDLASSRAFALDLRQSIFDIAREVDISSMSDKLGALTNFGLQVLWSDAIDKNDTKRQLYGDALLELNRRLLVLAGWTGEESNPGNIQWGDALPVNLIEEMQFDKLALDLGVVDKETVARRYEKRYGVDWETIQANLAKQKETDNEGNANIGAEIIRRFGQGQGVQEEQEVNA